MDSLRSKIANILILLKENPKLVLASFLSLLFLFIIFTSFRSTPQTITPDANQSTTQPSQTVNTVRSLTVTPNEVKPANLYEPSITWSPIRFTEGDLEGISYTKSPLPDGTAKYTYESTNPNRPNEIIVKNGIIIYQRTVVNNKYIYHYTNTLGAADYNFQSSRFYGDNTSTYVYLEEGTAFVADASTTLVKEQISFQPTNFEEFKEKYGQDIADYTVIPTLGDELHHH